MIIATNVVLYGLLIVTLLSLATVTASVVASDEFEKETVKLTGGFCAQSKKNPVMSWNGWFNSATVIDCVVFPDVGAHFVLPAPSTAEKGN